MAFVLKTRAITGDFLVPLNGEHIEYATIEEANDATLPALEAGQGPIYIVDFASDAIAAKVQW